jgi:hypothetical protein
MLKKSTVVFECELPKVIRSELALEQPKLASSCLVKAQRVWFSLAFTPSHLYMKRGKIFRLRHVVMVRSILKP